MLGVSVWVCSLERLAGEGACLSGRPRNRLFSNVQLPIIPAVINHPTLTNEVEQSASQSATQHTTTHQHRPDGCPSLSSGITLTPCLNVVSVEFFLSLMIVNLRKFELEQLYFSSFFSRELM